MASRAATSRSPKGAGACVALLRAVNVGGNNILPMADLARMFEAAGCAEVRTYIQSGNVVFIAPRASAKNIPQTVAKQIERRFGFEPSIVVRTDEDMARIAAGNPFLSADSDARTLHVGFLDAEPDARLIATLDPKRSPGDRFAVHGREIYLHLPNGFGKSKLTTPYFDSTLSTTSTFRNWRTVLKLVEMMGGSKET